MNAQELRREALEIFDGSETSQDVRDVIEWYTSSIQTAVEKDRQDRAEGAAEYKRLLAELVTWLDADRSAYGDAQTARGTRTDATLREARAALTIHQPSEPAAVPDQGLNDASESADHAVSRLTGEVVRPAEGLAGGGAAKLTDDFRGDTANLIRSIRALIELNDAGALVPHGIGGHARALLSAAACRLAAPERVAPAEPLSADQLRSMLLETCDRAMTNRAKTDALNLANLRRVMREWHAIAVKLGYDCVSDLLDAAPPAQRVADAPAGPGVHNALENCRLFAARHRRMDWAMTILRFCTEGGATGSPLRGADDGIELAARWVQKRLDDYDAEHGSTDPETGTREYPGRGAGDEYVGELIEIIEGIRSLAAPTAPPAGADAPAVGATSAATVGQPSAERVKASITLTGLQLKHALYWAVPDDDPDHLEAEVTIAWSDGIESEDEEQAREPGYVLWWADYPEEGCVPLDDHPAGTPATHFTAPAGAGEPNPLDDPRLQELFGAAITGAMALGYQNSSPPPEGHWLTAHWNTGRAQAELTEKPARSWRDEVIADEAMFAGPGEPTEPSADQTNALDELVAEGQQMGFYGAGPGEQPSEAPKTQCRVGFCTSTSCNDAEACLDAIPAPAVGETSLKALAELVTFIDADRLSYGEAQTARSMRTEDALCKARAALGSAPAVEGGEPIAWQYVCKRAPSGGTVTYASVDDNDSQHWPMEQWRSVERTPLAPCGPAVELKRAALSPAPADRGDAA